MYYIYADEISIVSAYFGLPQCTAFGPAGYSCLINRHKANKQGDHLASSAGISPDKSGGGKFFFSKPIRRLEPIERHAEEASDHLSSLVFLYS
jgi:hypothetical protein